MSYFRADCIIYRDLHYDSSNRCKYALLSFSLSTKDIDLENCISSLKNMFFNNLIMFLITLHDVSYIMFVWV